VLAGTVGVAWPHGLVRQKKPKGRIRTRGNRRLSQQERASRRTPASERLVVQMLPSGLMQGSAVGHQRARTEQEENQER